MSLASSHELSDKRVSLFREMRRFAPALLIAALVAWHGVHNWLWLQQNTVLTGWDKARHLAQSLAYNNLLTPLTLRSFFAALISDTVRPPLAPMSAVLPYRLFGVSGDIAAMANLVYLAVTLIASWKLGALLGGRRLAALSVVLLALFPMFYAMSRYFYLEFPLMALVAVTIWLLLATDGFRKRGITLLLGVCLGLGLLTKRTYVAFVFAPIVLVVLSSDVLPGLWQRLRGGLRIDLRAVLLAVVGGMALAGVWVLPNWTTVQDLALGAWLYPIWAGLVAITIYLLLRRPAADVNFLAALSLGITLGSLWYLSNPGFLERMLLFAYGVNDPRGRTIEVGSSGTYADYLVMLISQHVSLFISIILVAATLVLSLALLRRRRFFSSLRQISTGWWAVVLWFVGPYLVLTLSIYHEARAITPVLPAIALLGAGILLRLPWKRVIVLLVIVLIAVGLVQFYAVSFEPLHGLVGATLLRLPLLGETSLLGWGGYLQLPDSAATDPRYWIQPDVLQRMEEQRLAQGWDRASLGLLVNAKQINFEHFAYLTLEGGYDPQISVERLARAKGPEPVYPRLFKHDYLLVKRENAPADADSQQVINLILDQPPALFQLAFELDKLYPLPDGDTVHLYRRRIRPPEGVTAEFFPDLGQTLTTMLQEGDAVIVVPPALVPLVGQYSEGDTLQTAVDVYTLSPDGSTEEVLAEIAGDHDRILAVLGEGETAGGRWLDEHGYRAWEAWFGPTQLVVYGVAAQPEPPPTGVGSPVQPVGADLGENVTLVSYAVQGEPFEAGGIVYLTLWWQARRESDGGYKVFVHLVNSLGQLIAQRDGEPASGLRPTTTWRPGETITDRVGLYPPPGTPPGDYELLVGMYEPATLERLPVLDAWGQVIGDSISLGSVRISAPAP